MGCCEGKTAGAGHSAGGGGGTAAVKHPKHSSTYRRPPNKPRTTPTSSERPASVRPDKLGIYHDFPLWSPVACGPNVTSKQQTEMEGMRNSTKLCFPCPTCGLQLSCDRLFGCCPKALLVNAGGKKLNVQAAVAWLIAEEKRTLEAQTEHRHIVRLQRWWKSLLTYRRWFGVMFLYVFKKLDVWQERKRRLTVRAQLCAKRKEEADAAPCYAPVGAASGSQNHSVCPGADGVFRDPVLESGSLRTSSSFASDLDVAAGAASLPPGLARSLAEAWPRTPLHLHPERENVIKLLISTVENGERVPVPVARKVLTDAETSLRAKPNIQHLTLCERTRCVVVGDLHGQLEDLMRILREFDMPSPTRHYVFNGDFVDRGSKGCEVVLVLLSLHLAYPQYVTLNRGNHEDEPMCENYEFRQEALSKYNSNYPRFIKAFKALPLCTIIQNEIFVVHGGVPRDLVNLDDINAVNRFRDIPTIPGRGDAASSAEYRDRRILADMTWSDPIDEDPFHGHNSSNTSFLHNADRGNGIWFRRDHTENFLRRNGLRLLIRSHEAQETGFCVGHDSMLITVFSASYYAGAQRNDGAVAVVGLKRTGEENDTVAPPPGAVQGAQCVVEFDTWKIYSEEEVFDAGVVEDAEPSVVQEVLRMIRDFIYDHRHRFMTVCSSLDDVRGQTGTISCLDWSRIMRDVSGCEDIPWEFLRPWLAEAVWTQAPTQSIPFLAFLRRYSVPLEDRVFRRWAPYLAQWILHKGSKNSKDAGELFDRTSGGHETVHYQRFFSLLMTDLAIQLSSEVVFQLFCYLDKEGEGAPGYLRREGWIRRFGASKGLGVHIDELEEDDLGDWFFVENSFHMWDLWLVQRLRFLVTRCGAPLVAFNLFDTDGDGKLGSDDLRDAIRRLNLSQLQCPARRVTYLFTSRPGTAEETIEIEQIAALYGETPAFVRDCMALSTDRSQHDVTLGVWPLSDNQVDAFLSYLDYDGDGAVTYADFLQAFYVMDLHPPSEAKSTRMVNRTHFSEGRLPNIHRVSSWGTHGESLWDTTPLKVIHEACTSFRRVRARSGSFPGDLDGLDLADPLEDNIEVVVDDSDMESTQGVASDCGRQLSLGASTRSMTAPLSPHSGSG
eukprot:Rhum_TRINITY_DN14616_c18_g1::Rhum_TRINITY_DN14616_c18_g1_i1::g.102378::m.102378